MKVFEPISEKRGDMSEERQHKDIVLRQADKEALKDFLLSYEWSIAGDEEYFGDLSGVFFSVIGREPKESI